MIEAGKTYSNKRPLQKDITVTKVGNKFVMYRIAGISKGHISRMTIEDFKQVYKTD